MRAERPCYYIAMMTNTELREALARLDITQTELSAWLGLGDRAVRRYVAADGASTARQVPPALALLIRLLDERPELIPIVEAIAAGHAAQRPAT